MKIQTPITEIMTTQLISIQENNTLTDVITLMRKHNIRHIPVLWGEQLIGMISSTDINRISFGALFEHEEKSEDTFTGMLQVKEVMNSNVKVAEATQTIEEVAQIFTTGKFHSLPVVYKGKLVGIVSTTDIILYFLKKCGE